jgi:hypothetical protein
MATPPVEYATVLTEAGPIRLDYSPTKQSYGPTALRARLDDPCPGCREYVGLGNTVCIETDSSGCPVEPWNSQIVHSYPGGCQYDPYGPYQVDTGVRPSPFE